MKGHQQAMPVAVTKRQQRKGYAAMNMHAALKSPVASDQDKQPKIHLTPHPFERKLFCKLGANDPISEALVASKGF